MQPTFGLLVLLGRALLFGLEKLVALLERRDVLLALRVGLLPVAGPQDGNSAAEGAQTAEHEREDGEPDGDGHLSPPLAWGDDCSQLVMFIDGRFARIHAGSLLAQRQASSAIGVTKRAASAALQNAR